MARNYKKIRSTKNIWLFCEGKKTEKNYFNGLITTERIGNVIVKDSNRTDSIGLLREAITFKKSNGKIGDEYYCIFDRNSNTNKRLNEIIDLARQNKIKIIFSNPCFEYWVLCHFEGYINSIEFDELNSKLKKHFGYKKGDPNIYIKTKGKLDNAVKNAKEVRNKHNKKSIRLISRDSNPFTEVYCLVEFLFRFRKK